MDTPEFLKESIETDWHKHFKVSVPDTITMAQLVRWVGFGFVPLPKENELTIQHQPIFGIGSLSFQTVPVAGELQKCILHQHMGACDKMIEHLGLGDVNAKCLMPNGTEIVFAHGFWNPKWITIYCNDSSVRFGVRIEFNKGVPSVVNCDDGSELFKEMSEQYGCDVYSGIIFDTNDVAKLFNLKGDVARCNHGIKEKKNPKNAGSKVKSKMMHPTIAFYIRDNGLNSNKSKMAHDIYEIHSRIFGEDNTADTETIRKTILSPYYKCHERWESGQN